MKRLVVVALILISPFVKAQEAKGIKFEQGLTWTQIKQKARSENKYIFLDGYTTWCGPCKMMAKEIFPQTAVGEFFNKNFINVAVQFDSTKNDNDEIKRWYKDAKELTKTYKIDRYPTYIFLDPTGKLVHTIIGSSLNANEFISKAEMALNPQVQFYTLKKQYEDGKKDNEFFLRLINSTAASRNDQTFLRRITNEYLSRQQDLLKSENIKFILTSTERSSDPGFLILLNSPEKIDSVAGMGKSEEMVNEIVFDEIVLPIVRNGGAKVLHEGGMISYKGTLNKDVNWTEIRDKLHSKYPLLAERLIMASKPIYYDWANDWPAFTTSVSNYIAKYKKEITYDKLNSYARRVLYNCNDPRLMKSAINWSETILSENPENIGSLYNYGSLLYKSGEKEKAVKIMQKAISVSGDPHGWFAGAITKINNGEKLW